MRHRISNNTVSLIRSEKEANLIKKNRGTYLVYSVIKRFKQGRTKDQKRRPAGDNCPILYAMKGRDNLIIQPEDIRACPHFALHQIKMQAIRSMAL